MTDAFGDHTWNYDENPTSDEEDYIKSLHGLVSSRPYIRSLHTGPDDMIHAVAHQLVGNCDADKYSGLKCLKRGQVTFQLKRRHEKNMLSVIEAARLVLSTYHGEPILSNSISCAAGFHSVQQCVEMVRLWDVWHSHWAYNTHVSEFPPVAYPLRRITVDCTAGGAESGPFLDETRSLSARDKYSEREEISDDEEEQGIPSTVGDSDSMSSE